jgi:hypothetical protein
MRGVSAWTCFFVQFQEADLERGAVRALDRTERRFVALEKTLRLILSFEGIRLERWSIAQRKFIGATTEQRRSS